MFTKTYGLPKQTTFSTMHAVAYGVCKYSIAYNLIKRIYLSVLLHIHVITVQITKVLV